MAPRQVSEVVSLSDDVKGWEEGGRVIDTDQIGMNL